MKEKFWLCKRGAVFYAYDSTCDRKENLRTKSKDEARQLL